MAPPVGTAPPKKPLLWSAALNAAPDGSLEETDRSHVPPVLRGLRKCEACGFPVSASRVLCVECEEKKWRGQLRVPQGGAPRQSATSTVVAEKPGLARPRTEAISENKGSVAAQEVLRATAKAEAITAVTPAPSAQRTSATDARPIAATGTFATGQGTDEVASPLRSATAAANPLTLPTVSEPITKTSGTPGPDFVLSAGLSPQSWLSANKYIIGGLLVAGAVLAAVFLLR